MTHSMTGPAAIDPATAATLAAIGRFNDAFFRQTSTACWRR